MEPLQLYVSAGDEQPRYLSAPPAPRVILASADAPISPIQAPRPLPGRYFYPLLQASNERTAMRLPASMRHKPQQSAMQKRPRQAGSRTS